MNLTKGNIQKQIRSIAIPAIVGFFFNTMYNVVDTYFGGLVSTDALAALSLSFPVFFIIIAMGSGISTGTTALIANAIGAGDEKKSRYYAMQALSFSVLIGLILTAVGYLAAPFLFRVLGASGEYLRISLEYINIILLGSVFFGLTFVINGILNARGDTKTFRNFLIVGFFLNLLLNPALMFGWFFIPALGLAGVAWATVIIQVVGVIYMGSMLIRKKIFCSGCSKMLIPKLMYFKEISKQGFPASLNMMTIAAGIFIITYFISPFGKAAVAAYGIATRIDQLFLLPSIGLNIAALTLIGQNNGAGMHERCREVYRICMKYGTILSLLGTAGVLLFAGPMMGFFSDDPEVVFIGVKYLRIAILVYLAYTYLFISVSVLQGFKKPGFAVWIGLYRQILAPLVIFYLFSRVLGWDLYGIWWGIFVINWTAVIISIYYVRLVMRKILRK